jgi:tetrapyrrole methylase family protein / MazG family protein
MANAFNGITLLGLGPGKKEQLTLEAWEHLSGLKEVVLRTRQHPTVAGFPSHLAIQSFDELYEGGESFEAVYAEIVERVLALGRRPEGVTYAVPGHPYVAEATAPEIARRAKAEGLDCRVIEGVSFLEPVFSALGIDPFPELVLVDALELGNLHTPGFPPDQAALVAQIYNRQVAAEVKLTLNAVYPDEHRVRLVHAAGTEQELVEDLALYEIDRSEHIGLLSALYVPALAKETSLESFQEIVAHLRAPDGCPWDKEQTMQSLSSSLLEETYEALDALDTEDMAGVCEELGDLVLLITMYAQIGSEEGHFAMTDVIHGIASKIVRRHPHVFGDVAVDGTGGVLRNWENIKEAERKQKGKHLEKGILDGISKSLPGLSRAQKYQDRAAHVGFDWPEIEGVREKVLEEWREVEEATDETREKELGDLLFAVVNLIRWYKLDAESALRKANHSFYRRFKHIEAGARAAGKKMTEMSLDEMEALWQEAKKQEPPAHGD